MPKTLITETIDSFFVPEFSITESENSMFDKIRTDAFNRYQAVGIPTRKHEDWRYVPLKTFFQIPFQTKGSAISDSIAHTIKSHIDTVNPQHILVFINGEFSQEYSQFSSNDLQLSLLSDVLADYTEAFPENSGFSSDNPFEMMNLFSHQSAYVLTFLQNTVLSDFHVLHVNEGQTEAFSAQTRLCIKLESQAKVSMSISHYVQGDEAVFDNAVTRIELDPESSLSLSSFKTGHEQAYLFDVMDVSIAKDASFSSVFIQESAAIIRQETRVYLKGEGACNELLGLSIPNGNGNHFVKTDVEMLVPNCTSSQKFKSILTDHTVSEYNGLVYVHPHAQKIESDQLNRNLILDDTAIAYSRPQLRIYADDVVCTHGSTTGEIEKQELLYLMSRGLAESQARSLLIYGFCEEIVEKVSLDNFQSFIKDRVKNRLKPIA